MFAWLASPPLAQVPISIILSPLATPSSHPKVEIRCRVAEEGIRVEAASRGAVKDLLGRQVLANLVDMPA
jgi:hypothetical protein